MTSTLNIRKFRILSALKDNAGNSMELGLKVDNIHTLIDKAVYGVNFSSVVINPEVRLRQIKGWQGAIEQIQRRIVQSLDEINFFKEIPTTQTSFASLTPSKMETALSSTSPQILTTLPPFVQTLLNITPGDLIKIGPNNTSLTRSALTSINWDAKDACITQKVLIEVFGRQILATHIISVKPSPAFVGIEKQPKMQLNPSKVEDIICFITSVLNLSEKQVRKIITTKCADEAKLIRARAERKLSMRYKTKAVF